MAYQEVVGQPPGYEVNVLFLQTSRHDPRRVFASLVALTAPLRDLLLLTCNATPRDRTRNTAAVLVGWDNQWMPDRPGGFCTQIISYAPAEHEWPIRGALIDETNVLTPEDCGRLIFHELGHVFGVYGADHVGEGGPDFMHRFRAKIRQAMSHRR